MPSEKPFFVFVTKYALTQGILQKEVCTTHSAGYVVVAGSNGCEGYHKPFWHEKYEDATKHAESMQTKKIASLKKQFNKIKSLSFN